MENSFESKVITLLKRKESLMDQEESPVFLLSVILEDFISEHLGDSRYELELSLADRLDHFFLNGEKSFYYEA